MHIYAHFLVDAGQALPTNAINMMDSTIRRIIEGSKRLPQFAALAQEVHVPNNLIYLPPYAAGPDRSTQRRCYGADDLALCGQFRYDDGNVATAERHRLLAHSARQYEGVRRVSLQFNTQVRFTIITFLA